MVNQAKYLILFFLLGTCINVFSQKVKYEGGSITSQQYPLKPLPKNFFTYSVVHSGFLYKQLPNDPRFINDNKQKDKAFELNGYNKVKENEDFKIKIFYNIQVQPKTEHQETGYINSFYLFLDIHADIVDTTNKIIDTIVVRKIENELYKTTGPFANKELAQLDIEPVGRTIQAEVYENYALGVKNSIADKITILTKKIPFKAGFVKEDIELVKASELFNSAVALLDTIKFNSSDRIKKDDVLGAISVWETKSSSLGELNEKNEDFYLMLHYNLARGYFLVGNYEKSKSHLIPVLKIYNTYGAVKQLSWAHIYNFNELVNNIERRLLVNGL